MGIDVDIFNDKGKISANEKGELVVKKPFPTMPIKFWKDPKNKKFKKHIFQNTKTFGTMEILYKEQGMEDLWILGRSDATLNPGGVRIGTAEIYRQVENIKFVSESLVVGHNCDNDIRIILFVVLNSKQKLDKNDIIYIKNQIRKIVPQNTFHIKS